MSVDRSGIELVSTTEAGPSDWGLARVRPGESGGVNVVALSGDLTRSTARAIRTALIDALGGGGPRLVLDLTAVRTCDEEGVRAISLAAGRALRRGGGLRLAGVPPQVRRCLEASPHVAGVYDRVATALSTPWRTASAQRTAG